ncbi:MAG: hypothetical protein Q4P05_07350 [Actinomycetaceae bacterium]|nr:hypothetical protein [Actinomycetaceae bacterium]
MTPSTRRTTHSRRSRSVWRDSRFLLGVALIIASVAMTTWIVNRATEGEELYRLNADIALGQPISINQLVPVEARTGSDAYIRVGALPDTPIATRSLSKGELLPSAAVSSTAQSGRRQVVIEVSSRIPSSVDIGDRVEIWSVRNETVIGDAAEEPLVITREAIVLTVTETDVGLGVEHQRSVEVSVPEADLAHLLTATGADARLVIVPMG